MDKTKEVVIYALAEKIRQASAEENQDLEGIDRMAHAIECVLAGTPVDEEAFTRTSD